MGTEAVWRWQPTPSSAEVKKRVELHLYSPSGPSWPVLGWTLPLWWTLSGHGINGLCFFGDYKWKPFSYTHHDTIFSKRIRLRENVRHFSAAWCSTSHYKHYSLFASAYIKYLPRTKFFYLIINHSDVAQNIILHAFFQTLFIAKFNIVQVISWLALG
jgi:hypothetical protein